MTRFVERRKRPSADDLFELMSVLAHDLRTPLTPIKGYAEILRSRPELGPDKTAQYAGIVAEAAGRMERSVELLSGISALYGGRAEMKPEAVRAADLLAERTDLWRGRHPGRVFERASDDAHGAVFVDRGWLGKALDVLLDRLLRAVPADAPVTLAARSDAEDGYTSLSLVVPRLREQPAAPKDRLGLAFLISVSDVCGYPLPGDFTIDVPAAKAH